MDTSEFHREKLPASHEEESPEDPIDPMDSDVDMLDKMERDYNQEDVYQNLFEVQDPEAVHDDANKEAARSR